ncbi:5464_t:CDS:2, partial [Gigaspora rosea]
TYHGLEEPSHEELHMGGSTKRYNRKGAKEEEGYFTSTDLNANLVKLKTWPNVTVPNTWGKMKMGTVHGARAVSRAENILASHVRNYIAAPD